MRCLLVSLALLLPASALAHDQRHDTCAECPPRYVDAIEWTASIAAPQEIAPDAETGPTSSRKQDLLQPAPQSTLSQVKGH